MSTGARAVEAAHLATTAVLTVVMVGDPTTRFRSGPGWSGWLRGQQSVDRVMSRVAPPLFLSTAVLAAVAALVAAGQRRPGLAAARAVATGCVVAVVRVTLKVNEPENARLRTWRPGDVPPDDWRAVRARWDEGHRQRRVLVAAAAGAVALGVLADGWPTARRPADLALPRWRAARHDRGPRDPRREGPPWPRS